MGKKEEETSHSQATGNLDLAFCVDNTGSMGQYIAQAQANIKKIVEQIITSEKVNVRFALVHYRDHKDDYVVKSHPFTDESAKMLQYVNAMSASGGGDGPEAVAAGLEALKHLEWRKQSTKIVVFIADAPPHGIEPFGDDYPNGDPQGIDPLAVLRELIAKEIMIYSVGCEPAINSYQYARAFMNSLATQSGGRYFSLAQAGILADVIIYGAREEINLDKYANEIEQEVEKVRQTTPALADTAVYAAAAQNLQARGVSMPQMKVDSVVDEATAYQGAEIFAASPSLAAAKTSISSKYPTAQRQQQQQVYYSPSEEFSTDDSLTPPPYASLPPPPSLSRASGRSYGSPSPTSSSYAAYPSMAAPTSAYSAFSPASAAPSPQQAYMEVSPISSEQVQRLVERKQNQKSYMS